MKKTKAICSVVVSIALALSVPFAGTQKVSAKTIKLFGQKVEDNSKVQYSFHKGTLTVTGFGIIDDSYTSVCKKSSIKKLVVGKGITGIADKAFEDCSSLETVNLSSGLRKIGCYAFKSAVFKTVTVPKTVKEIGYAAFDDNGKLKKMTIPGDFKYVSAPDADEMFVGDKLVDYYVKTIAFNSPFDPKNNGLLRADSVQTYSKDKKYKSYDGKIYTKDGKTLVAVPKGTTKLTIRKGCKKVLLSSFCSTDASVDGSASCCHLKEIKIPASVKEVKDDKQDCPTYDLFEYKLKIKIESKKLTGKSIENLGLLLRNKQRKAFFKNKKLDIKVKNHMYIKNHILLRYDGKNKKVKIPSDIKRIGGEAFYECKKLKTVQWNKKLREVGDSAFAGCTMSSVNVPSSVKKWGCDCFAKNYIKKIKLPQNMKVIPKGMFAASYINELTIPGTVKKIDAGAFYNSEIKKLALREGVEEIAGDAFGYCKNMETVVLPKSLKKLDCKAFCESNIGSLRLGTTDFKIDDEYYREDDESFGYEALKEIICDTTPEKYMTMAILTKVDSSVNVMKVYTPKLTGASGYELEWSSMSDYSNSQKMTLDNQNKTTDVKVSVNLSDKYYVRIRPYTTKDGKNVYGKWTKVEKAGDYGYSE
ncbi:MAG: leucine-rich repeat domain-containing protein [Eubacterium sp.]|nr:leucine-rich repeat domain-containing protein [Eubacterium sp.]